MTRHAHQCCAGLLTIARIFPPPSRNAMNPITLQGPQLAQVQVKGDLRLLLTDFYLPWMSPRALSHAKVGRESTFVPYTFESR
jgi:hypothetical protein